MGTKTALVLSAGGMFGAYQAGAWKALLAAGFRPDIVVGASAGALNAWAIAGGASPDALIEAWMRPDCATLAALRRDPAAWRGILDPKPLERRIRDLWSLYRPVAEIGVVAVELPRLRTVLFRNGEITWRHLAASCAVPLCFPAVELGGRRYADGGLLNALPLWAAAQMGAGRVIAIHALTPPPSRLFAGAIRAFRSVVPRPPSGPEGVTVTVIGPSRPLGALREVVRWSMGNISRWVAQGEADGREALSRL